MFTDALSQTDIEMASCVKTEPKHEDADSNSQSDHSRQSFLKPHKDKTDEGRQKR